ncbi:MAG: GNAT family N-acetyltransferase, partial [Sneathiella sp.]|nr:GNAT family N-acetyltransferase [Sneathiella sp.]
ENEGQFSDWQPLLNLIQIAFSSMENRIDPPSSMHKLTVQNLQQKATTETLFYAKIEDVLVGCAFASNQNQILYVGKVSISPDYQGRGIGQQLMQACKHLAQRKGIAELEVQTRIELVENHVFFNKLGFVETSKTSHDGYDEPTCITLRCKV